MTEPSPERILLFKAEMQRDHLEDTFARLWPAIGKDMVTYKHRSELLKKSLLLLTKVAGDPELAKTREFDAEVSALIAAIQIK